MTTTFALRTGACLSALMIAPAAWADVTAQQVWEAWQDSMSNTGRGTTITTGDVADDGAAITVTDFVLNNASDSADLTVTIPQIVFAGSDDGTVAITLSDTVPISFDYGDGKTMDMSVTTSGASIFASGAMDDLTYDVAADRYVIAIDNLVGADGPIEGDMSVTLNGVSGSSTVTSADMRDTTYDMAVTAVDLLFDVTAPDQTAVTVSGKIDGIAATGTSSAPADMDYSDPAAMFGGAYSAKGGYTSGPSAYIIAVDGTTKLDGTSTSGPGTLAFSVGDQGLSYSGNVTDVTADLTSSEMPFPFRLSAASYGFGLTAPVAPTDAPAPFALLVDVTDVAVNEEIWAMFDPAANLPRDPATVRLDLSGAAKLDVALMDPAQMAAVGQGFPGELESLTLNELTIDAVGASVDGTGNFTFDNADTTTFPGVPRPDGQVELTVKGANGLIDKLIAMGLVPSDQAMMGRMMLGMFARDVGDDTLESVIEVKDGQVLANGQRIR